MFGRERNREVPHDTEDRGWWYLHGEKLEEQFVALCQGYLNIRACINPDKTRDKTVPDLLVDGCLADLKTQNTPFFTADRYGMDPRFSVTFNRKDYERYKNLYPNIIIYFWIDWKQTAWNGKFVDYFGGVFRLPFVKIASIIEGGAPEHHYINRRAPEDPNGKSSFILDVREFESLFVSNVRGGDF